jgi:hypothetical protein
MLKEEQKDEDAIAISDFLIFEKGEIMRTEGFYVTKAAQVKGNFRFNSQYIEFTPSLCKENESVR